MSSTNTSCTVLRYCKRAKKVGSSLGGPTFPSYAYYVLDGSTTNEIPQRSIENSASVHDEDPWKVVPRIL